MRDSRFFIGLGSVATGVVVAAALLAPLRQRPVALWVIGSLSTLCRLGMSVLEWGLTYPLIAAEIGLIYALMAGLILRDYGVENQLWHEDPWTQCLVGLSVSLLFTALLAIGYFLNVGQQPITADMPFGLPVGGPPAEPWTAWKIHLFDGRGLAACLGSYLLAWQTVLFSMVGVLAIIGPRRPSTDIPWASRWKLVAGYAAGLVVARVGLGGVLGYVRTLRAPASWIDAGLGWASLDGLGVPGGVWGWLREDAEDVPLPTDRGDLHYAAIADAIAVRADTHTVATLYIALMSIVGVGVMAIYAARARPRRWPASTARKGASSARAARGRSGRTGHRPLPVGVCICLLFGLAATMYGVFSYRDPSHQVVALLFFALLGLLANLRPNKVQLPGLESYYLGDPVAIADYPLSDQGSAPLLKVEDVLRAWKGKRHLPKLAVVAVSGGANLSAVWSVRVLTELQERLAGFAGSVRLITGASGGMVGAAYWASAISGPDGEGVMGRGPELVEAIGRDSLSRVVQAMVLHDIPLQFLPFRKPYDRGWALEDQLCQNTEPAAGGDSPLAASVRSLAAGEAAGWRPSLVFSPMSIETGRRLLISNLDLEGICRSQGAYMTDDQKIEGTKDVFSQSAAELFKLFPGPAAAGFKVVTAARMSASFPYASPAVALPTKPRRRMVDAGYYDNYGVDLAASWIAEHAHWLKHHTGGVVLIQLRDAAGEMARRTLSHTDERPPGLLKVALEGLLGPLQGAAAARESVMAFRNDEEVEVLDDIFNGGGQGDFFTTVVFEYKGQATMDWCLTKEEHRDIVAGFDLAGPDCVKPSERPGQASNRLANRDRFEKLNTWWLSTPSEPYSTG